MSRFIKLTAFNEPLPVYVNAAQVQEIYQTASGCNLVFAWHEGYTSVTETAEQILKLLAEPEYVEVTEEMVEAGRAAWLSSSNETRAWVRAVIEAALRARKRP